jgi:Uma2 family endonuclease
MPRAATSPRKRKPKLSSEYAHLVPELPNLELPEGDGEPLESDWHVLQIHLLIELVYQHWKPRTDFFAGGNMVIYYSLEQARSVIEGRPLYKGPDFFVVKGVDGTKPRKSWIVWEEGGKYPDVIIDLTSPTTARKDKEENLRLYAEVFGVSEYFWYDPDKDELRGYRLVDGVYEPLEADERGWLWSAQLEAYVGVWEGVYWGRRRRWVRLWDREGHLVLTAGEEAERERQRAEQERQRAEQLAQRLRELGVDPDL